MTLEELDLIEITAPYMVVVDDDIAIAIVQSATSGYHAVKAQCPKCTQRYAKTHLLHDELHTAIAEVAEHTKHHIKEHNV